MNLDEYIISIFILIIIKMVKNLVMNFIPKLNISYQQCKLIGDY